MKISSQTLNILKNFSTINSSLVVRKGSIINTVSNEKNIKASYTCPETFGQDFAIYDLGEFLGGLTIFESPEFDFSNERYVVIQSGKSKIKYFYCDASLITTSDIPMPTLTPDVEFNLSDKVLHSLLKSSSIYNLQDMSLIGDGSEMNLVVCDKENKTSNTFSVKVGDTDKKFRVNFKVENLKIIQDDYKVQICFPNVSSFCSSKYDLQYLIALEPDSDIED
jgi:hypothetical protein